MFKEKIQISSLDVDFNGELKLSSLFKYMQQVASHHVAELKLGSKELIPLNLLWVVIRMNVEIYRYPRIDEAVTFTTHPGDMKAFIYPRYFEIYDEKGNLLIAVSSMWCLINSDTRKVVLKPDGLVKIDGEPCDEDLPLSDKIRGDATSLVETRKVKYSEIDLNRHLNNTKYIEFIEDCHDSAFFENNRVTSLNINYDKEIKENQTVELYSNGQNPEIIKGMIDGNNCFTVELKYESRR